MKQSKKLERYVFVSSEAGIKRQIKLMGFDTEKEFTEATGLKSSERVMKAYYPSIILGEPYEKEIQALLKDGYVRGIVGPIFIMSHNRVYPSQILGYKKGKFAYADSEKLY